MSVFGTLKPEHILEFGKNAYAEATAEPQAAGSPDTSSPAPTRAKRTKNPSSKR